MKAFAGRGIVCGAVLDTAEVLADPHLRERENDLRPRTPDPRPLLGDRLPGAALDPPVAARRAPLKGEHTEDVLRSLAGYTPEKSSGCAKTRSSDYLTIVIPAKGGYPGRSTRPPALDPRFRGGDENGRNRS